MSETQPGASAGRDKRWGRRRLIVGAAAASGQPGQEVSWQVTGIRQDAWANAHRIPVEVDKSAEDRGRYLHPRLFPGGQPVTELLVGRREPARN